MADDPNKPPVQDPPKPENKPPAGNPPGDPNKPPAAPPALPEKYELKLADGSPFTDKDVEKIAAFARSQKFSQEQAAAYLAEAETRHVAMLESQQTTLETEKQKWQDELKTHQDFGGDKLTAHVTARTDLLSKYEKVGGKEFVEMLNETGFLHHPLFNGFVAWILKATKEDKPPAGGTPPGEKKEQKPLANRMFPNNP